MIRNIHLSLFFLLIFSIPINLSKHFILKGSYVSGVLVDYLIPTIYLTDIICILIIGFFALDLIKNQSIRSDVSKKIRNAKGVFVPLVIFLVTLFINVHFDFFPSFYKFLKILEMCLIFLYAYLNFSFTSDFEKFISVLSLSVLFQSQIAFIQWLKQASVFNNFLFFGEQPYSFRTPGIIREGLLGSMVIPPYGTFPHPNALGGFLAISLCLILYFSFAYKFKTLNVISFFYGTLILFLTFSLTSIFAFLVGIAFLFILKSANRASLKAYFFSLILLTIFFPFSLNFFPLDTHASLYRRVDLTSSAVSMIKAKPFFGVGLNLFTKELENYGKVRGIVRFVQPVHNVFLLIASESGVIALLLFAFLLGSVFIYMINKSYSLIFIVSLVQILFISSFDHYFYTLQQGLLLFWLTLGVSLSTINANDQNHAHKKS